MFGNAGLPLQHDPGTQAANMGYHTPINPPGAYSYTQQRTSARSVPPVRDHANSFLPPLPNAQGGHPAPAVQTQPGASTAPPGYALSGPEPLPGGYSQPDPRYYNPTDAIPAVTFQEISTTIPCLQRDHIELKIRQQPKEALIAYEGKEKARKPVDPPPILQIIVDKNVDGDKQYLQSPYVFMCASLYKPDVDEPWDASGNKSLAGSVTSSLHRLKDTNNEDGGFFVFGDISVKVAGMFRLHFSLFDLRKDLNSANYLGSVTSDQFRVCLPKDYRGLEESTYLSRAFSDQGVRLRLRKEPRGPRRAYPYSDGPITNPHPNSHPNRHPRMTPALHYGQRHSPYQTHQGTRRALMHTQGGRSPPRRFQSELGAEEDQNYGDPSANVPTSGYSVAQYPGLPQHTVPLFNVPMGQGYGLMPNESAQSGQFHPDPRNMP